MFAHDRPIYQQIRDMMIAEIISGRWKEEECIPSIRTLSMELDVNPNTVLHTLNELRNEGILESERGIGNKVVKGAAEQLVRGLKNYFEEHEIGVFVRRARLLGFDRKALCEAIERSWNEI